MADMMPPSRDSSTRWCSECWQETQVDKYLRDLVKNMAYELFTCMKCKKINPASVFFCNNNHCYCSSCITSKCLKCEKIAEFSDGKGLKNVKVTCDWPRCNTDVTLVHYITHKRNCLSRPYQCPLSQCQTTVNSTDELQRHWHCKIPQLVNKKQSVQYEKYDLYEFYWLLDNELYRVLIDFSKEKTDILIEEIGNVLPNNNKFFFKAYCSGYKKWDEPKELVNFGGKFKLIANKSNNRYDLEKIQIYYT